MTGSAVTIRLSEQEITGELNDSATARELLALLPLEVQLEDFLGQEKLGRLPRRLTTSDAPMTSGAGPGDLGYYAPSQHLVLYYAEVGAFPGIIRIGRFAESALDLVRDLVDGTVATIVRS